jgi:dolichyl-phosphate-mannose-protein mannosyltransferase
MTTFAADVAASDDAGRLSVLRARLVAPMPRDGIWGWVWPLLVTAFGGFLRFNRLAVPRALIFDETYYVKDAWSILHHGTEWVLAPNANSLIQAGSTNIFAPCTHAMYVGDQCGEYVVQPELGKELIAVGEAIFGLNSFG